MSPKNRKRPPRQRRGGLPANPLRRFLHQIVHGRPRRASLEAEHPATPAQPTTSSQGTVYANFLADQLKAEHARRESLDDRAVRLQQSAALLLGLFSTALGVVVGQGQRTSALSLVLFALTAVLFVIAAGSGVCANRLIRYRVADEVAMLRMVDERWTDSHVDSLNVVAFLNAQTTADMRAGNDRKAKRLSSGHWAQVTGLFMGALMLLTTAGIILSTGAAHVPVTDSSTKDEPTPSFSPSMIPSSSAPSARASSTTK